MRIGVLGDIHGNTAAFAAVLEDLEKQRVDQLVLIGDIVVGAPDSAACWDRALELDCPIIGGNNETYVVDYGTARAPAEWTSRRFGPLQWTVDQFSDEQRRQMGGLPLTLVLPEAPDLLFVHSSARSNKDPVRPHTSDRELAAMFAGVDQACIVRGHNHTCWVRPWNERQIISNGSVGFPLDGNQAAQYAILERRRRGWYPQFQAVHYDVDATIRRFEASGSIEAAGPMARLFRRELATAGLEFSTFVRLAKGWDIGVDEGFQRYLDMY